MHPGSKKAVKIGVALAAAGAVLTGGVAQAQYYGYAAPAPVHYARVGPADPCARTAAQRALGWGIVGLIAGGLAGGAAAGAGVVAEGAGLGAFVGSIIGGVAGSRSAACGTAAIAAAQGAYGPFYGQGYPAQGGHPTYAVGGAQPVTYYEYRRTYRSYEAPQPGWQQPPQQFAPPQQFQPPPQFAPQPRN
ncbi:hypothetical protein LJR164_003918 [Phenylobacterium sp. LjRoot164]|uniref:hypothetical protein n=1 Tax=unclassified Phenylobacterium TaxID=2640670 RepID=UPI003ECE3D57